MVLDKEQLTAVLVCLFWIKSKENPSVLKNPKRYIRWIFKDISTHSKILPILDKDNAVAEAVKLFQQFNVKKNYSEAEVLSFLDSSWKGKSEFDLREIFEIICFEINIDNKVSTQEFEALKILQVRYNLSSEFLDNLLSETRRKAYKKDTIVRESRKGKVRWKVVGISGVFIISVLMLVFTGYSAWVYMQCKKQFSSFDMAKFLQDHPRYVFKKATFYKYVIYGSPDSANKHFRRLNIYHVKGTADFQFDMTGIKVDEEQTDVVGKVLCLRYTRGELPLEVDVNIKPEDIYPIPVDEVPEPMTDDEARTVARCVSVPAALVGAAGGAKIGSLIGGSIYSYPGRFFGGIVGMVGGGASAGAAAYVLTSKFLAGLQLRGAQTLGGQEKIIEASKPLIALELMGAGMFSSDSWNKEVKAYYQKEFERNLQNLFKSFGWKKVKVIY